MYTEIVTNIPIKQRNAHETGVRPQFFVLKTRSDLILFAMK